MIDAQERASMVETVRGALADAVANGGKDIDAVLASLGWLDLLAEEPDDAIGIVFGALGATNATATALDDVMAVALGRAPSMDLAVVLPPFAAWDTPARIEGGRIEIEFNNEEELQRLYEMMMRAEPRNPGTQL